MRPNDPGVDGFVAKKIFQHRIQRRIVRYIALLLLENADSRREIATDRGKDSVRPPARPGRTALVATNAEMSCFRLFLANAPASSGFEKCVSHSPKQRFTLGVRVCICPLVSNPLVVRTRTRFPSIADCCKRSNVSRFETFFEPRITVPVAVFGTLKKC